jgi:hypothetical protein
MNGATEISKDFGTQKISRLTFSLFHDFLRAGEKRISGMMTGSFFLDFHDLLGLTTQPL